jgi:hypothetical protein
MESLAPEVEPFGIRTMIVEPGYFRTELLTPESTNFAEGSIDDYAERTAQIVAGQRGMDGKQVGNPAKLAAGLVELASLDVPPDAVDRGRRRHGLHRAEGARLPRPGRRSSGPLVVPRPQRLVPTTTSRHATRSRTHPQQTNGDPPFCPTATCPRRPMKLKRWFSAAEIDEL